MHQASASGKWAVEARAATQCAAMPGCRAPPAAAAFHSSFRRLTPMLSLRASASRVATQATRATTGHPIITVTIAIEEQALRVAATLIPTITGSAPVPQQIIFLRG